MNITRSIKMSICVMLLSVAALSLTVISQSVVRAKDKSNVNLITSADLDHAFVQGATVKYLLLDEEIQGAPLFYSNGTIVRRFNAEIIVDYIPIDARTDQQGRRLFRLKIDRPDILGGPFEKDAPHDPGRDAGTFDSLQPGDLRH